LAVVYDHRAPAVAAILVRFRCRLILEEREVRTIPGVGQNAYYNILAFVGVKITQVDSSQDAMIQPSAVMDPTAVFDPGSVVPAGTTSTLISTFTTPKLTQ
jgi:hypothetical protein